MMKQTLLAFIRRPRTLAGLVLVPLGLLIFLLGTRPQWFGQDRSPVFGFVQISIFLVGLGIICFAGYLLLSELWVGKSKNILSDIGLRLVGTGYLTAVVAGMADVFGFGSETAPITPIFGGWQAIGVLVGEITIAIGFLLVIPPARSKKKETPSEE